MEKRSISGRDILRMDGLLPPTRRLPVCNAVTSPDKKKEKKWSIGGILKRISLMKDYDSSSNDEEIEYCTRQPRPRTVFNKRSHNVVLHPVDKTSVNDVTEAGTNNDTTTSQKDTLNSRSSDGSLDGLSKKARKSKLKARIEAKRDRICADSSSDEDSRKSTNSLTRYQNETVQGAAQKNGYCNRKSRAARTERYMKRLSRDEGPRFSENLSDIANKRASLDFMNEEQLSADANELFRPMQSSSRYSNSNTFPVQRSVENLRQSGMAASNHQARSSNDLMKSYSKYITDMNQNNTYAKPNVSQKSKKYKEENVYSSPVTSTNPDSTNRNSPPEPPPRDPRCRLFAYSCNSFPFNGKYRASRYDDTLRTKMNDIHEVTKDHVKSLRSYDPNNDGWSGFTKNCPRRPLSLTMTSTELCNLSECTNNRHNSTGKHVDESTTFTETEAMKCRRRNDRNDQITSRFKNFDTRMRENKFTYINVRNNCVSPGSKSADSPLAKSPIKNSYDLRNTSPVIRKSAEEKSSVNEQEALERRRSSKNLEEALSELEAIYNSLRLGDEDLLDRAERRSMEEFNLRQAKTNAAPYAEDLTDRTRDDMAYRRMHPKERPASLSEVVSQSAMSNISYLIASPIESRKNPLDDYLYTNYSARRDVPDVTRDDVVYRSINRANNTLKVVDPQPPFGIPLGPVTTATESDYLHTTPKLEQPRSPYIPQCEPDIVTDDMAYRTLRKDSGFQNKTDSADRESFGTKKKAVRSLSANLYGLIDHDRIHLRRESNLRDIKDGINAIDVGTLTVKTERRVVSDGELSDYDTRWRGDFFRNKTDINGNHTLANGHRQKLRVYVSPSTRLQSFEDKIEPQNSPTSDKASSKALNNELWEDRSKPSETPDLDTEPDFMAYSRLCQDLVNLIEGQNEVETKTDQTSNKEDDSMRSLNDQCSKENEKDIEELTESLVNPVNEEKTGDDDSFDFYLRVADENVKLIAEAFSSVADHLRDSRSSQKNSVTSRRSEIETETSVALDTSTRDDLDDDQPSSSPRTIDHTSNVVPTEDTTITLNEDQVEPEQTRTTDPELDLTRAVHDLQLAAASLCEHEKEIQQLEALLRKDASNDVPIEEDTSSLSIETDAGSSNEDSQKERDQEETVVSVGVKSAPNDPNCEGLPALDHS
ncbi:uncharacterized protein LOC108622544 isoform X2 [Ceratina calcarata]|uniref:Uncharacterized protein LOC108622544 isoform X2 n=1 Tax=Ceratina calcarata TaxID=156304 RepID=A0AAJ7IT68_9HYME|nr:uncharacterized protein LOC108622544 isoform X2 [Ceratina calcarata]